MGDFLSTIVAAVFPLLGVVVGGCITVIVSKQTQKHTDKAASRDFKARKLELLHERLVHLEAYGRHTYSALYDAVRTGKFERSREILHGLPEIEFLIRVLFPDKPDLYEKLDSIIMGDFGHQICEAIVSYQRLSAKEKEERRELISAMGRKLEDQVAIVKAEIYGMMNKMLP